MSFSNTATEQREKEAKSVKSFLAVSLIGSLAVHIGIVASGLTNLLSVAPQIAEDNPIEITFVEPQTQEKPKPPQEKIEENRSTPVPIQQPQPRKKAENREIISPQQPAMQQQQAEQPKTPVSEKPVESSTRTSQNYTPPANNTFSDKPTTSSPETDSVSRDVGGLTGNETDSGIAFGNSNNRTNTTQGNNTITGRRKRGTVATRANDPELPTEIRRSRRESNNGSGDGRASCRECDTAYPEQARRNGVEGRVEVAVDTDARGNVTNVRVVRSSGNRDLDEATVRQARDWKLKPSQSGRQGVTIGTEYAIEGSQRHRQLQESTRQRQAQQRRQQTTATQPGRNRRQMETATNSTNATTPQRPRAATSSKKPASSNTATSNRRVRRNNVATNSSAASSTPRRQQSARRVRRNNVAASSTRKPAATPTRRQRRQPVVSNNRLRQSTTRRRRELNGTNNRSPRRQRQLAAPATPKE